MSVAGVTLALLMWWYSTSFRNTVSPCHGGDSSNECRHPIQGPVLFKPWAVVPRPSAEECTLTAYGMS